MQRFGFHSIAMEMMMIRFDELVTWIFENLKRKLEFEEDDAIYLLILRQFE